MLGYHDLMKHSVFARQAEIDRWAGLGLSDGRELLEKERESLESEIEAARLPEPLVGPAMRSARHLAGWVSALEQLEDE